MRNKQRISFLINDLGVGGAERALITLCNEWVKRHKQVLIITVFPKVELVVPDSIRMIHLLDKPIAKTSFGKCYQFILAIFRLRKVVFQEQITYQ